jgi:hypothetical protein
VEDKPPADGLFIGLGFLQVGAYGKLAVVLAAVLLLVYLLRGWG